MPLPVFTSMVQVVPSSDISQAPMMPGTMSPPPIVENISSINTLKYFTSGPPAKGGNTRSSSRSATNTVTLSSDEPDASVAAAAAGAAVGAAAAGALLESLVPDVSDPPPQARIPKANTDSMATLISARTPNTRETIIVFLQ
ncbi:MAG: Uncharacterised protein [Chloroflexota bacterium]|nr:MAG: Uncharacterised protein [Chloroflexota bacterium]